MSGRRAFVNLCFAISLAVILICASNPPNLLAMENNVRSGLEDLQVDPHSGSATFSYPILVPPGRGGIQPNVALSYNSNNKNGVLGVGWSFEIGSIHRSTKRGVPKYDNSDTYTLMQNGGTQELILDTATGYYHPEIEGAFMRIEMINDYWVITDRTGVQYYFGETQGSREFDPNSSSRILKWCLNKVEDIHGNYMEFVYMKDGEKLYPEFIRYTGNSQQSLPTYAEIEFAYSERDDERLTYRPGFRMTTAKRLTTIFVRVENVLMRKYDLTYQYSDATMQSLLTSIVQYGSDGITPFAPTTFSYNDKAVNGFTQSSSWYIYQGFSESSNNGDNGMRLADVNGDGLVDVVQADDYPSVTRDMHLNTGTDFIQSPQWYFPAGLGFTSANSSEYPDVRVVDINGDGLSDIVWAGIYNADRGTYINDGNGGFVEDSQYKLFFVGYLDENGADNGVRFADMNGDGLIDVVWADEDSSQRKTYINKGAGFTEDPALALPIGFNEAITGDNGVRLADINGDGLTDILWADQDDMNQHRTFLNKGNGFVEVAQWIVPQSTGFTEPSDGNTDNGVRLVDINGDGLPDIIQADEYPSVERATYLNTGTDFVASANWHFPADKGFSESNSTDDSGVRVGDMNGDGLPDIIQSDFYPDEPNVQDTYINDGLMFNLLQEMDNGVGGKTTIVYDSSGHYPNTLIPFPVPVVQSVTVSTAQLDSYTTTYEYADGLWDSEDREFRGFGMVKVIDADGNYTATYFHQDDLFRGRPYMQETYDVNDNLYAKTENVWGSQTLPSGAEFVYLQGRDNFVYDGDSTGRRTAEEFFYEESPQYGNVTKVVQFGEVDLVSGVDTLGNDKRTVETLYIRNTNYPDYLVGLPKHTLVRDSSGNIVRQAWFHYDDHPGNDDAPLEGLLTKKIDWAGDGPNDIDPVTTYTYDDYGNLESTVNPIGNNTVPNQHKTTIVYDSTYQLFPITTTNVIGHPVKNMYYGIGLDPLDDGQGHKGLWGQLKATNDPNNNEGSRSYDVFGRLEKTVSPLDTIDYPTSISELVCLSDHMRVIRRQRVSHGDVKTIDSTSFIDGLGRSIQSKAPSYQSGQYTVNGQTEYNSRGLPIKQYLPYFVPNSTLNTIEPIDPAKPYSMIDYDAMGRVIKTTNPDGNYSTVEYDDWTVYTANENGHMQASVYDAYGRLIEKREYTGADGRSPHYQQTTGSAHQHYELYATTKYEYDSEGNLTKTIDEQSNEIMMMYDNLGRKISMNDPDMGQWTYVYDLNSNLKEQTDGKAQTIYFTYDELNRLTQKSDLGNLNVTYTYDNPLDLNSKGRLSDVDYAGGYAEFQYDTIGREIESIKSINGIPYRVKRSYDALNNIMDIKYPDDQKIYYDYNDAGQIKAIGNDPVLFDQQSSNTLLDDSSQKSLFSKLVNTFERYVLGVKPAYAADFLQDPNCVGAWAFDETTGDAIDLCAQDGNDQNGTVDIDVVRDGTHYTFNGDDGHVDFGDVTFLDGISIASFCLEAKVESGDLSSGYISLFRKDGSWTPMQWDGSKWRALLWTESRATHTGITTWIPDDGQWHSYCYTYDGAQRKAYRDGGVITGGTYNDQGGFYDSSKAFYIGGKGTSESFKGDVKNVIIFNRTLDDIEVLDLHANGFNGGIPVNEAPSVDAGNDSAVTLPAGAFLNGSAMDDGLPLPTNLTTTWTNVTGPPGAAIAEPGNLNTTVSFTLAGIYIFRLTADDAELSSIDDVVITVNDAPPASGGFLNDPNCVGAWAFGETTGDALDLCAQDGFTQNGTVDSDVVREGNHFSFNGDDGHVDFGDVSFLDGTATASFCLEAQVDPGDLTSGYISLFRKDGAWTPMQWDGSKWRALLWTTSRATHTGINTWLPDDGQWHSYCYTYDGAQRKAYRDGVVIAAGTYNDAGTFFDSAAAFYIGGKATSESFRGNIKNVIILDRALADSEVVELHQYGFDGGGEATNTTLFVRTIEYNPAGQIDFIEYGNGVTTDYQYDNMFRLIGIYTIDPSGTPIQDLNYTYDSAGNVLTIVDNVNSADQTFQYDHLNRLVQATAPESYGTKNYQYDTIGNITQKDGRTYTYGEANAGPHAVTRLEGGGQARQTYTYDDNGNMLTKQVQGGSLTEYQYDVENRLTEVKKDSTVISQFEYDGDGGRTEKITQSDSIEFVGSLYEEANNRSSLYVYMGSARVAQVVDGRVLYYHHDHLGGTNILTDDAGYVKRIMEYQPYGTYARNEEVNLPTAEERAWYAFTSQYHDEESELYFYNARYYDPSLGRFITPDTVVPNPNNPQDFNRYSYVHNNPINNIDPTGHWSWKKFWKGFAGAVVGGIVTALTGGLAAPAVSMFWGGLAGGAVSGGLNGGWKGALIGGLSGGILGGGIGLGIGQFGNGFGVGALVAGAGVAGATDSWDSFSGGITGGIVGFGIGNGIDSYLNDGISNQNPQSGIRGGTNSKSNENWEVLGIRTGDENAAAHAAQNQTSVFYTKSRGFISDFTRAGIQKVFRNSLASRQLLGHLRGANGKFIYAHSEGTLTLAGAAKALAVEGGKLKNTIFDWNAPVISRGSASNLSSAVGAQSQYNLNWGDPIGVFTTLNPVQTAVYGTAGVTTMTSFHSTSHYRNPIYK